MKFTLAFLSALVATTVSGLAIPQPNPEPEALAEPVAAPSITADQSDANIIESSAVDWDHDANLVSAFIDACHYKKFHNQKQYLAAAKAALAAEEAEFAFLEALADYLLNNPSCQAANSTLTDNGTWDNVKELLEQLTELDWVSDQAEIQQIIGEINFGDGAAQGRCDYILPAFDTYFTAAGQLLKTLTGSNPIQGLRANVPSSCSASSKRAVLEA